MINMVAMLLAARAIPKVIAIVYAIFLIFSSASVAIREQNPSAFLVDGIGKILTANDFQLQADIEKTVENRKAGISDWWILLDIAGSLFLFYYIIKIFHFALKHSFEMASPAMLWVWAVVMVFLLETIALTAISGHLYIGFSGIIQTFLNLDSVFYPFYGWVETIGQASIKSPLF